MNKSDGNTLLEEKIIEGLELTKKKLLKFKKEKNSPLVVTKNGKVIEVYQSDEK